MNNKKIGILARFALLSATIIWGTTFFIMEETIENIGIYSLLAIRFTIAAVLLSLFLVKRLKKIDRHLLFRGFLLGLFVITAYILQTYGLADEATTPGKNAFLTATYCIIVPFLAWLFKGPRPDRYNIVAALMCILGITLISVTGNDFSSIFTGDLLTLLGGLFYSFHMVAVSVFSKKYDVLLLTMLQFAFSAAVSWALCLGFETLPASLPMRTTASIIFLALMATCLCYILQNIGQKYTPPATASLIMGLEAVFGVLFSVIFTSETITAKILSGFILVFLSVVISEVKPFKKPSSEINLQNLQ